MSRTLTIVRYGPDRYDEWQAFVERSNEGTLFHRLDFLAYHGTRFHAEEHHLIWLSGQEIFSVMPLALGGAPERTARSPYGASYGGPIFAKPLSFVDSRDVVASLIRHLRESGVTACRLTLPLYCHYATYSDTFRLALMEQGFQCVNRDICSVVPLGSVPASAGLTNARHRELARKARKTERAGVTIVGGANVQDFWRVADKTFEKLNVQPTHTNEEFQWLCKHLPRRVHVDVAYVADRPVAGIGYFVINQRVNSSFYLCQDPEFQATQALSALLYRALIGSQEAGFGWFDLGTSSAGMRARENLFRFKESFGAIGLFRETYEWHGQEVSNVAPVMESSDGS